MTYFFIGGSARSGTHLLESIVTTTPDVNAPLPGASHFHDFVSVYAKGKQNFKLLSGYFKDSSDFDSFYSSWISSFLKKVKKQNSPSHDLILRWPYMATLFPTIHELVPDAKFILIIRDPRDTIVSMIKVAERELKLPPRERTVANLGRDMVRLSRFYLSYYLPSLTYQSVSPDFAQRVLWVKYESIVQKTGVELNHLARFMDLDLGSAYLDNVWQRRQPDFGRQDSDKDVWSSSLYGQKISDSHVGQYKKLLTEREIQEVEYQCRIILEQFGYCKKSKEMNVQFF